MSRRDRVMTFKKEFQSVNQWIWNIFLLLPPWLPVYLPGTSRPHMKTCLSIHTCSHFPGCLYSRADNTFYVSPFLKVKRKKFLTGSQRFLDAPLSPLGSQALTSHAHMKILLVIANSKQLIWHCKHICISQKTSWPNIYLTGLATRKGKFIVLIRWIYLEQGYQLVNICDCKEVLDPHIK